MQVSKAGESALEVGVQIKAGVAIGPGCLVNIDSNGQGKLADDSSNYMAHGVALTSGAGTKTTGMSQFVRLDRHAVVEDVSYITVTKGGAVYLGEDGQYKMSASSLNQKVGVGLDTDKVWVDLDMDTDDS